MTLCFCGTLIAREWGLLLRLRDQDLLVILLQMQNDIFECYNMKKDFFNSFPAHFYCPGVFETICLSPITWYLLGSGSTSFWNSIFTSNEDRTHVSAKDNSANRSYAVPTPNLEHSFSTIQLREVSYCINVLIILFAYTQWLMETLVKQPPVVLKPSEHQSEQEALEIAITKLLLKSYYNIVRKNVEDFIPKAIMHFLVCHYFLTNLSMPITVCLFFTGMLKLRGEC